MISKNTSGYPELNREEHSDEDSQDAKQSRYPGTDQKPAWMETDTTANFVERIKELDSDLAQNIDLRLDITMERRARMEAVIDGFKSMEFTSTSDDMNSVSDVAKAIFQPVYQHMEYGSDQGIDRQEWTLDERLGRVELLSRQYMFESALRDSKQDTDGRDRYSAEMDQSVYEPLSYPKEKDNEYTDRLFDWLKENMQPFGENAVQEIVEHKMSRTNEIYGEHLNTNFRSEGSLHTIAAAQRQLGENIWETLQRNDPDSFKEILDQLPERDINLATEIRENAGFTNIPPEESPSFTHELTTITQKEEFVARMNNIAENFNTPEYIPNPDLRNALENQVNELNLDFKDIQESTAAQGAEPLDEDFFYFRLEVEALKYITRPRDPEFWKMVDSHDSTSDEVATDHVIQDKIHDALDAVNEVQKEGWEERETAQRALNALTHVYDMNIKSDLIDEDIGSYQTHVKEMEAGSEVFTAALRDGTGFIESPGYESPRFPQWADQSGTYLEEVSDKLRELNLNEEIQTDHFKAVSFMIQEYASTNHEIIAGNLQNEDDHPEKLLIQQTQTLRAIQILMRPKMEQ